MSLIKALFNRKRESQSTNLDDNEPYYAEEEELEEEVLDQEPKDHKETDLQDSETDTVYEVVEREIQPAKIICPDCGGITLEGLEFCDKCGGELL